MDSQFWLNVVVRWIHVTSAAVGVGAAAFVLWGLMPAAKPNGGAPAQPFTQVAYLRFRRLVHSALGLLLLTGVYNLFLVMPRSRALGSLMPVYHGVLGTKILLALAIFAIATATLSRSLDPERFRAGAPRWLTLCVVLALLVLFLSAVMRRLWDLDPRLHLPSPGQSSDRGMWIADRGLEGGASFPYPRSAL
jgi:putative copper export protein